MAGDGGLRQVALPTLAVAAALLGACGGGDDDSGNKPASSTESGSSAPRYAYPPETVRAFVNACVASAGGQRPICRCTIDRHKQTQPIAEIQTDDAAIDAATESCRE